MWRHTFFTAVAEKSRDTGQSRHQIKLTSILTSKREPFVADRSLRICGPVSPQRQEISQHVIQRLTDVRSKRWGRVRGG